MTATKKKNIVSFVPAAGQEQKIEEIAEMIHASKGAAIRNLIDYGYEYMNQR